MPTESDSKTSNDSQKTPKGWLAKCGIAIPILAKRKRVASPHDKRDRVSIQYEEPKVLDMESESKAIRKLFDAALDDIKAVNDYTADHSRLLQVEADDAWDRDAKTRTTSRSKDDQAERKAGVIIHGIREYERRVTFGNLASEAIPGPDTRDMGGQFLTNKERIDTASLLYKIAKAVPKGCLLHLHFNAELHPELLLLQAREIDNIYIRSIRPLITDEDLSLTEMVFNVLDPAQVDPNVDIFSPTYPGNATNWKTDEWKWRVWMKWDDFRKSFDEKGYGKKWAQRENTIEIEVPHTCSEPGQVSLRPAENWLKAKMVLSTEEAYDPSQTVNGVWARFNQATRAFKGLLNYEGVYKWYIGNAIDRMIEEKVMYAELRPMLLDKFIPANDGIGKIDNAAQMRLIIEGVKAKQRELEKKGELHKFPFGLKIIYCTPRSIPRKMMQEEMKQCIELKLQFPDLICGFDLVGAEDRPNHIGFYKEELVAFKKVCQDRKLDIPFLFHAGETLLDTGGSTDPKNSNLYDAVVLGSKRIGHGFSLMKHPHLVEKFKKTKDSAGICIELCPISNELLHLCRNIKEHPFPELLAAGIPCTVNSDNPSLFSNSMSHEFYQIMVGAPTISLSSWKQLARWSIEYSCLSHTEKRKAYDILASDWRNFCRKIVDEYSDLFVGDVIDDEKAAEAYAKINKSS